MTDRPPPLPAPKSRAPLPPAPLPLRGEAALSPSPDDFVTDRKRLGDDVMPSDGDDTDAFDDDPFERERSSDGGSGSSIGGQ